jgi:hypothetical protein
MSASDIFFPLPSQVGFTRLGHPKLNSGTPEFRWERTTRPPNPVYPSSALGVLNSARAELSAERGEGYQPLDMSIPLTPLDACRRRVALSLKGRGEGWQP